MRAKLHDQIIGYTTAALGLVAGLAWNDAISTLIATVFPGERTTVIAKFVYAILLTVIVVGVTAVLVYITQREKK